MNKKHIWITGASSGIGAGFAEFYANQGFPLIISARRKDRLESLKKQLSHTGVQIQIVVMDVALEQSIEEAWQVIIENNWQVGTLINNAGISQRSNILETKMSVVRRLMEVNFFGAVCLTQKVAPHMLNNGEGHIITIASLVAKFATPRRSAYAASKHAIIAFMDSLRAELWRDNIRVTTICPGYVKTELSYQALTADGSKQNQLDDGQKNGLSVKDFVSKAMYKIERGSDEVYIGGKEVLAIYLKRFLPNLFNRVIRTAKVT
jgi:dehydrogenase/reductase SDR family member 7B